MFPHCTTPQLGLIKSFNEQDSNHSARPHYEERLWMLPRILPVTHVTHREVNSGAFPTSINCPPDESLLCFFPSEEHVICSSQRWRPGPGDLPTPCAPLAGMPHSGFRRPRGALDQRSARAWEEMRAVERADKWTGRGESLHVWLHEYGKLLSDVTRSAAGDITP